MLATHSRFKLRFRHNIRREMSSRRRSWPCFLPLAAVLLGIILLYLVAPHFYASNAWRIDDVADAISGTGKIDDGADIISLATSDDLTVHLTPNEHQIRAARKIRLEWNLTKDERRPDGVAKDVYLINNQFPGPLVECRSGDELFITVANQLAGIEDLTIHWHGVHTSNDMDGASGLTQCPIRPGKSFTYRIKIDENQSGTFWYHSHFETQRADGLYGPLVIHKPATILSSDQRIHDYVDDQVLMIGDWYHRSAFDVLDQYDSWKSFKIEPTPDSILLNGKGFFDCSMAVPARPVDCTKIKLPHLKLSSGRSRLRIINTGSLTGFSLALFGYDLELIKVDGGNGVQPTSLARELGVLYPGERVDVVVQRTESTNGAGRITVALDQENIRHANQALRPTQQFSVMSPKRVRTDSVRSLPDNRARDWIMRIDPMKERGLDLGHAEMPLKADKPFLLYATMSYLAINSNRPKGYINHTTWAVSERFTPLLALDRVRWPADPEPFVPETGGAQWIDIVLNNFDDRGHPFHLHGHDFYVLTSHAPKRVGSYDLFNPFDNKPPVGGPWNLLNPLKKDTVYVPSMGYVVLRFRADNPGLWLLHCHIIWHQSIGMGMAFQIGDSSDVDVWRSLRESAHRSCFG